VLCISRLASSKNGKLKVSLVEVLFLHLSPLSNVAFFPLPFHHIRFCCLIVTPLKMCLAGSRGLHPNPFGTPWTRFIVSFPLGIATQHRVASRPISTGYLTPFPSVTLPTIPLSFFLFLIVMSAPCAAVSKCVVFLGPVGMGILWWYSTSGQHIAVESAGTVSPQIWGPCTFPESRRGV